MQYIHSNISKYEICKRYSFGNFSELLKVEMIQHSDGWVLLKQFDLYIVVMIK